MGRKIFGKLAHYGMIQFMASALILYLTFGLLYDTVWLPLFGDILEFLNIKDTSSAGMFAAIIAALWLMTYFIYLRSTLYHDKTGRRYGADHGKYGMSYSELVDYFHDADNKRIPIEELPVENWKDAEGIIFGHIGKRLVKRSSDGVGNCLLSSLPGGGKTTSQIIPSAMRFLGSVLCIDIKGDVLNWVRKHTNRMIKVFAPNDASISCHFDPLGGIKKMDVTARRSFIEQLGLALVPDEPGDNSNAKFFVDGGRDFWNGISLYLLSQNINTGFMDIVNAILTGDPFYWINRVRNSEVKDAKFFLDSYYGANERNISGQYKKICDCVRPFTNGALPELLQASADAITPQTLDAGYDIYIEIPQDMIQIFMPITTIIVQNFMNFYMGRPDSSTGEKIRPILMLLDEFPQLQFNIDTLLSAMETLRQS